MTGQHGDNNKPETKVAPRQAAAAGSDRRAVFVDPQAREEPVFATYRYATDPRGAPDTIFESSGGRSAPRADFTSRDVPRQFTVDYADSGVIDESRSASYIADPHLKMRGFAAGRDVLTEGAAWQGSREESIAGVAESKDPFATTSPAGFLAERSIPTPEQQRADDDAASFERAAAWREYHEMMGRHKRDFVDRVMGAVAQAKEARVHERDRREGWRQYHAMMERLRRTVSAPSVQGHPVQRGIVDEAFEEREAVQPRGGVGASRGGDAMDEEYRRESWREWHAMMRRHKREFVIPTMQQAMETEKLLLAERNRMSAWRGHHEMMHRHEKQFVNPILSEITFQRHRLEQEQEAKRAALTQEAWREYHDMMDRHRHTFVEPIMTPISLAEIEYRHERERREAWREYHEMMQHLYKEFTAPIEAEEKQRSMEQQRGAAQLAAPPSALGAGGARGTAPMTEADRRDAWRQWHAMMRRHRREFIEPVMKQAAEEELMRSRELSRSDSWKEYHAMMRRHQEQFVNPTAAEVAFEQHAAVRHLEARSADAERMRANAWNEYHGMMQRHKEQFVDPVMSDVLLAQREATIGADKQTGLAVRNPVRLFDGGVIPQLGFGTFPSMNGEETVKIVEQAIRAGFRHIDTAAEYGNEKEVGSAITKCIREGIVKREELFITTKLWNTNHEPSQVRGACEASLSRLGLKYVDLFLMHWPVAFKSGATDFDDLRQDALYPKDASGGAELHDVPVARTWAAMETLVKAGLTRYIGVSNFSVKELMDLVKIAKIPIAVHQVELHPGLPQKSLRMFHTRHHIVTEASAPLGVGAGMKLGSLLRHPYIVGLAHAYEMSPAEMLLRWNLSEGNVVVSKSATLERIKTNAAVLSEPLPLDLLQTLNAFGTQYPLRTMNPAFFRSVAGALYFDDGRPAQYDAAAPDELERLHADFMRAKVQQARLALRRGAESGRRQRLVKRWWQHHQMKRPRVLSKASAPRGPPERREAPTASQRAAAEALKPLQPILQQFVRRDDAVRYESG